MMQVISALKGFAIQASDGKIGSVVDFLFDDSSWKVRWLVVDCGSWLRERKVLIHPSAVSYSDLQDQRFEVPLTKAQVEGSPDWSEDQPVSRQMESRIYDYYGWDPLWGAPLMGGTPGAMASPLLSPPYLGLGEEAEPEVPEEATGDAHLRSFVDVVGYRLHAVDGEIGHVENFLLDNSDWSLGYFIVDTSNWWFGKRVLIAPVAVTSIEWSDRRVNVDVTREQVETSPTWDPLVAFQDVYAKQLHKHYGWPGSRA